MKKKYIVSPKKKFTKIIALRLTQKQFESLKEEAMKEKKSMSELIRKSLFW